MDLKILQNAVARFQTELFSAITTATYNGKSYDNGQKAKEALIRSQSLIMNIHECTKVSVLASLNQAFDAKWEVHPPVGFSSPELKIYGLLKAKNQDLVFLREERAPYTIESGPNAGARDSVGEKTTATSLVIGVRSQMSSVDKNFDTLMERAFAETLNLRLRTPVLCMGEVYLLPLRELDDQAMLENTISFKRKKVNIEKFIRIFDAFSGRQSVNVEDQYRYDASALVLIDLEKTPAKIITCGHDLASYGIAKEICLKFDKIAPKDFDARLINNYKKFHSI